MANPHDVMIREAEITFEPVPFRAPLKFGGRTVTATDLINARVIVENRQGKQATGYGSMPVGNVWAWPSNLVGTDLAEQSMKRMATLTAGQAIQLKDFGHSIDLMLAMIKQYETIAGQVQSELSLPEPIPVLAQLVANSPLDAAVHDAYGRLHQQNSFNVLSAEYMNHDLSHYLGPEFAGEYLDRYTLREPQPTLPLYHLVGALDPLTASDVTQPIGDGLPETLEEWILADGLTHLKIKLSGEDPEWDLARIVAIEQAACSAQQQRNCQQWWYSLDFNEKCKDVNVILTLLEKLQQLSPGAWNRIQYIEQPTHRDLHRFPENTMHAAAKIKPVVIDESLVSLESLQLAELLGYTGVAFKACKGQTETLLFAAAAQKKNMFLCVQDLTCPGFSFLHSASIAAHIPGVAAIEGNGRQYCPAPNQEWAPLYPGMFEITDGTVQTGLLGEIGLGFSRGE